MSKPLDGLLVIALEQAVAAPYCSSRLADAGARVIKIERPEGDFARGYDQAAKGQASYFVWLNRGKESLVLDIKKSEDAALLQRLLARADVFIQNLLPGAAERAGVGSAALRLRYPRLITCDISGYGNEGPYAEMRAYDMLVQCETGLASVTGGPDAPGRVGVSVCDIAAGMYAHQAILEALIKRGRTDEGAGIAVSLFDGMADWMAVPLMQHDGGRAPARVGLMHPTVAPYEAFPAKDGIPIVISIQNEREWARFCAEILSDAGLATHPDYCSNVLRVKNRPSMHALIAAAFKKVDSEVLAERLLKAGVAFGRLNGIAEFAKHPQLRRAVVATPHGEVTVPAPPPRIAGESVVLGRVPAIGEHSERIRREFA
ncbi:MAG: CoA transferase [Alphaproteobacteria bacterium]|nr:CoA transferase [Alphaproteobacteria bacterium]